MRAVILLLLLGLTINANGTPIPEPAKKSYIKGAIKACLLRQREDPLSKHLTDVQLYEFCSCASVRTLDFIDLEDLERMMQSRSNAHVLPIIEAAGNHCIQGMAKKWGNALATPTSH